MGVSTDGQICYGVLLGEEGEGELPWIDEGESYGDLDEWWLSVVLGFRPSLEIYNEQGDYKDGKEPSKEVIDAYYKERRDFIESHPKIPVEVVNSCSGDYPQWILAIPRTVKKAHRGYPEQFVPGSLKVTQKEHDELIAFCEKHKIEPANANIGTVTGWWLSSYWG